MIGAIENAIVDRLKAASEGGVLGYTYRDCESLPDDIDERLVKKVPRYPAAWPTFASLRAIQEMGQGASRVEANFAVVVGAENLRNERATRQGGTDAEVGSYQMGLDVIGLLLAKTFDLPITGLKLVGMSPITPPPNAADRQSLFKVAFTTEFVLAPGGQPCGASSIGDFETFHVAWDLPPHGDTDATQTIILETN